MVTVPHVADLDSQPTVASTEPMSLDDAATVAETLPAQAVPTIPDTLPVGTSRLPLSAVPADPHVGRVIGSLRIVRKLADGGMGSVYLAREQISGRSAAVKILLPEFARNRSVVQRFFNEARAAQSVEHPGVVKIYGADYDDEGNAYLVMEYLEGESLAQRIGREGRLSIEQSRAITYETVSALAAAHARGIVHRDLKPGNIFLMRDPSVPAGERVKLLDFGVAKLIASDTPLTHMGDVIGTPLFMAPEQCRGDINIDHRADLYALGCLLYNMLCGRPPFAGNSPGNVICAHLQAPVPPPRMFLPEIPSDLESLLAALLQKNPARRPQRTEQVLAMLSCGAVPRQYLADCTAKVSARGLPSGWRRAVVISAAGILATLAGMGLLMAF
ncbi:MAG: serine/threonine protein kinase [Proteobacteria bacterium]|nr:serine/threonine protein kinase [Pseudomonadota bacterium]